MGHPADASASEAAQCCHKPHIVSAPCAQCIAFSRPEIAQPNVTHLAWSSTGWAHEWTDTSWSRSRNLQMQCRIQLCSVSSISLLCSRPACPQPFQQTLCSPPKKMPQRRAALHVGWPHFYLEPLYDLFTLCAEGQSCQGGVLKVFPDLCTSTRPSLITGPQGDCKTCSNRKLQQTVDRRLYHAVRMDSETSNGWSAARTCEHRLTVQRSARETGPYSWIWKIRS